MSKHSLSIKFYPLGFDKKAVTYPLYCRITVNRKKSEFNTHVVVTLKNWDESKQRIKGNPEASGILSEIENNIRKHNSNLVMQEKSVTAQLLRDLCTDRGKNQDRLLDYYSKFQYEIGELKDEFTPSTIKKYKTIRVHLEKFLKTKTATTILMQDFNLKKCSEFEHYLKTVAKLSTNTTTKYLKQLKAIFNRALRFGHIEVIPFNAFKFNHEQTQREFLTNEEITKLEEFVAPNESLKRVRDMFLFSIFTGLRYSDVNNLKNNNLVIDKDGNPFVKFTIVKTNKNLFIPLTNKAYEIVKKYEDESEITGKLLPIISNQKINAYLKVLSDLAGIDKVLTYHMARHTFATTIALSNEMPMEILSAILGHSRITTTQIYGKITEANLLRATKNLNEKLK